VLEGQDGADLLFGDAGADMLLGDTGYDLLDRGAETDICNGADGTMLRLCEL